MLMLATGGVFVEVLADARMLLLPTDAAEIRAALGALRGALLLRGARGRDPVDLAAVVAAAEGLGALALDLGPALDAIDVNPLIALPDRAVVADALILLREGRAS